MLVSLLGILVLVIAAVVPAIRRGTIARSIVADLAYGGSALAVRALLLRPDATADLRALLAQPLTYVVIGFAAVGVPIYAAALRHSTPAVPSAIVTVTEVVFPGTSAQAGGGPPQAG